MKPTKRAALAAALAAAVAAETRFADARRAVEVARAELVLLEERQKARRPVAYPCRESWDAIRAWHAALCDSSSSIEERRAAARAAEREERADLAAKERYHAAELGAARDDLRVHDARVRVRLAEDAFTDAYGW